MKKQVISAMILASCLLNSTAQTAASAAEETLSYGILNYQTENGSITVTGCDSKAETVEIPSEIDGLPVTAIGPTAFYGCALKSVVIPEGVTDIRAGAFWHSKNLTEVSLPSTLTSIEKSAFNDCQSLAAVSFPESLTTIGSDAFTDTAWLNAQKEQSPFVIVNGILIDASAAVSNVLDEVEAEKERLAQAIADAENWNRAGIITNQEGYFPGLDKKATLLSDAPDGIKFELLSENGKTVYTGISQPKGLDAESGDMVHILDFSDFTEEGVYTLKSETGETSRTFRIGVLDICSGLVYDALNYFYQNRSGVEIEEQYITSGNPAELARAAGHAPDIAKVQNIWGYNGTGKQDVSGGWYDAGDHGKYVVNGGVSLWLMQNQYERACLHGTADAYQDGAMKIPENGNGIADLLDESRFEMEWMLRMIVQDGECKDMAYHKVHDSKWTSLATAPADDTMNRILIPPTTAATLNLAACGAQAYRLWKDIDPDFAETCLTAAKNAYAAAKEHPEMYASPQEYGGGGAYADDNVTDEFYWAACELYVSTGDKAYYSDLQKSGFAFAVPSDLGGAGSFDWGYTAALGSMTLLLHQDTLTKKEAGTLKDNLTETADFYLHLEENQGYGLPYQANEEGGYTWASNSFVSDNAIILAFAYDESADKKYLNGMTGALDYLLGRNPLDISYVTGYGVHSAQYPHHRWWAKAENSAFPKAPCGVLVGGANTGREDSVVKTAWKDQEIPPQKAYLDNIQAYSVNECAINWNASLAWTVSCLCEQNGGILTGQPSCGVQIPELRKPEEVEIPEITVTVPDGVVSVGEQIFGKYKGYVNEVILPDGVKSIGTQAFSQCRSLQAITIPETVEIVGEKAFSETPWLDAVQADSPLLIINGLLIDGTAAEGEVIVPENVTSVLGNAFYMNKKITSVRLPESVQNIGANAFNGCEALASLTLPESLKTIREKAFSGTAVSSLTIPAGVSEIESEAFINCKSLGEVAVLGTDTRIGEKAFGWTSTFTATGQYSYVFVYRAEEDFSVVCNRNSSADSYADAAGVQKNYFGDVDNDSRVSILDVIAINKSILGKKELNSAQQRAADVNHSGIPDAGDSLSVMKYIVGLVTSF